MSRKKIINQKTFTLTEDVFCERKILSSPNEERIKMIAEDFLPFEEIVLLAIIKSKVKKVAEKLKEEKLKPLTLKEIAKIEKETKAELAALALLPTPPFTIIIPAPGLSKLNPTALCRYVADKLPRITAVPAFLTVYPTVASNQLLYDALLPLSGISKRDLSTTDKINRDVLKVQLRNNVGSTFINCATLSNGNLGVFSLIKVATKRKGVRRKDQLPPVTFKLNTKKGKGKVQVEGTAVPLAVKYIVYYGEGEYDKATWNFQFGGAKILIKNLEPGTLLNFIMVAIGATGEGDWANAQYEHVPYS